MISKIKKLWNKYKRLLLYIFVALAAGFIGNLLAGGTEIYEQINTPSFAPPGFLFPIVWSILYILMGIGAYLISKEENNSKALKLYYTQLVVNSLWSILFFRFKLFAVSTLWLVLLIVLVSFMTYEFYKMNKKAALIQVPYILWIVFAFVLNYSIYLLN
ncbi:MAG: tryptophan-rich sensory protein [Clostridia bacterium]|nr:tryptophan-rich sensory protein [Clostridia bacterium]MBR6689633.1 tryptophan-rich sensory protein [Clostridia bacterium]